MRFKHKGYNERKSNIIPTSRVHENNHAIITLTTVRIHEARWWSRLCTTRISTRRWPHRLEKIPKIRRELAREQQLYWRWLTSRLTAIPCKKAKARMKKQLPLGQLAVSHTCGLASGSSHDRLRANNHVPTHRGQGPPKTEGPNSKQRRTEGETRRDGKREHYNNPKRIETIPRTQESQQPAYCGITQEQVTWK